MSAAKHRKPKYRLLDLPGRGPVNDDGNGVKDSYQPHSAS